MRAYHRSRAFAVQVEVAYVELAHSAIEFLARAGVNGTGQTKLGVVGDFERMIEVARFDHHQHWAKDFFLLERRLRWDVGNHRGLNKVAVFITRAGVARATGE